MIGPPEDLRINTAISCIEVAGETAELERWLGGASLPVRVRRAGAEPEAEEGGVLAIGVSTASGEIEIRAIELAADSRLTRGPPSIGSADAE